MSMVMSVAHTNALKCHRQQQELKTLHKFQISQISAYRRPILHCGKVAATRTEEQSLLSEQIRKSGEQLRRELQGMSIFLIGMMGSGKTTVGKIMADAMGYNFFDSDKLVEQAAGGVTIEQIFKEKKEEGFRDAESECLGKFSCMGCSVVATGGGGVIRPKNWEYFRDGITVWMDVPLEVLAKRVVAAGTKKRPLLTGKDNETVSYMQTLARLQKLYEERKLSYAKADITVSLLKTASEMGVEDPYDLSPSAIVVEMLNNLVIANALCEPKF